MKSFFPKLKPTISNSIFRVFAWPCITSKHHFVSKGRWNRFLYCPLFNNSYGNRTVLKQDDLDWSVLTWPFPFKFSPHNCITELFTINWISLNAKTTKRLFDRRKWIKLLVVSEKSIYFRGLEMQLSRVKYFPLVSRNCIQVFEDKVVYCRRNKSEAAKNLSCHWMSKED